MRRNDRVEVTEWRYLLRATPPLRHKSAAVPIVEPYDVVLVEVRESTPHGSLEGRQRHPTRRCASRYAAAGAAVSDHSLADVSLARDVIELAGPLSKHSPSAYDAKIRLSGGGGRSSADTDGQASSLTQVYRRIGFWSESRTRSSK